MTVEWNEANRCLRGRLYSTPCEEGGCLWGPLPPANLLRPSRYLDRKSGMKDGGGGGARKAYIIGLISYYCVAVAIMETKYLRNHIGPGGWRRSRRWH